MSLDVLLLTGKVEENLRGEPRDTVITSLARAPTKAL